MSILRQYIFPCMLLVILAAMTAAFTRDNHNNFVTIQWPEYGQNACMQSVQIEIIDSRNILHGSVIVNRPIDALQSQLMLPGANGQYFRAVAYSVPNARGARLGFAWGQFRRAVPTVITGNLDQSVQLHIAPYDILIFPRDIRQLFVFAENANHAAVLLPPSFVWSVADPYRATVGMQSGILIGGVRDGNTTVTVTNCSLGISATTKVLSRQWAYPPNTP